MYSINQINKDALKVFESIGFPHEKNEFWKYTNLKKFKSIQFSESKNFEISSDNALDLKELNFPTITILNGKIISYPKKKSCYLLSDKLKNCSQNFYKSLNQFDQSTIENNPFLILNTAHFSDGIYLKMDNNFDNILINIISSGSSSDYESSYSRIHIDIEKNTSSNIILHHSSIENNNYYKNNVISVEAHSNSNASFVNIYEEPEQSYSMNNIIFNQSSNSNIKQSSFYLSSGFIRTDIVNNLNQPDSYSSLNGLFVGNDTQFIDNNIIINHNSEHTYSKVLYKGVLNGKSNAVFNGLVNVPYKSKQIDSDQKNHNIILSKTAKINSNPKLKISCDDVKCAHGSTIGNLDDEQLFYLRSRGIDLKRAKQMLLNSFMHEIINDISIDKVKNYINSNLNNIFK